MNCYKDLQNLVGKLDVDFNKDEVQLIEELKYLEKENVQSLRKFKDVKQKALRMKEQLSEVVESCNPMIKKEK